MSLGKIIGRMLTQSKNIENNDHAKNAETYPGEEIVRGNVEMTPFYRVVWSIIRSLCFHGSSVFSSVLEISGVRGSRIGLCTADKSVDQLRHQVEIVRRRNSSLDSA